MAHAAYAPGGRGDLQLLRQRWDEIQRLNPSQESGLTPLPRPPTREELVDRGLALQELLALEEAPSGPIPLVQPRVGPTQLEKPQIGPSVPRRPSIPTELSGGKIVDGTLVLDESREAWKEFMRREPREIEPSLFDGLEQPETLNLLDSIKEAGTNLLDFVTSIVPETEAAPYFSDSIDLDRLIEAESDRRTGVTSPSGAYGLAQFMPKTWRDLAKDSQVTGVPIPSSIKGKKFKEVMDDEASAKLAAKTYLRMLEVYLKNRNLPVTVRNILGSYNMGPTRYAKELKGSKSGKVKFDLWDRWLVVKNRP